MAFCALSRLALLAPTPAGPSSPPAASPSPPGAPATPPPQQQQTSAERAVAEAERWLVEAQSLGSDSGGDAARAPAHGIPSEAVLSAAVALQGVGRHSDAVALLHEALAHHLLHDEKSSLVAHAKLAKSALCLAIEGDGVGDGGHAAEDELTLLKEELVLPRLRVLLVPGDPRIAEAAIVEVIGDQHFFAPKPAGGATEQHHLGDEGGGRRPEEVAAEMRAEHAKALQEAFQYDSRLGTLVGPTLCRALDKVAQGNVAAAGGTSRGGR